MPKRNIVVVGASAGGVEALTELVRHLPADLPAALFVVIHFPPGGVSMLPRILNRRGALPAIHAADGETIEPGHIYVSVPDRHLLVDRGFVRVVRGPHENGHRPAVDPLFRSAARSYGPRVVGVVLSGFLDDGTAGLMAIKRRGGVALVQDPDEALAESMPRSAIEHVAVDAVLPVAQIAERIGQIVQEDVPEATEAPDALRWEAEMAEMDQDALQAEDRPGTRAALGCPTCGGTLWEYTEGDLVRYRCRVGHAFSAESLLTEQDKQLEEAFWVALRTLEESASLSGRLAQRARSRGHTRSAERFEAQRSEAEARAEVIRSVLLTGRLPTDERADIADERAEPTPPPAS